jgi:hypothetical protein
MRKWIFIFCFFQGFANFSQNLVINQSFEDTLKCPKNFSEIAACYGWYTCAASPDYFNLCSNGKVAVPSNLLGFQWPSNGKAYAGLIAFSPFSGASREALGSELSLPLTVGKRYFVSFKFSLSDYAIYGCNNLGVRFSTIPITSVVGHPLINNIPQVFSNKVNQDYDGWTRLFGSFLADSSYKFFMIGNFFADSLTTSIKSSSPTAVDGNAYYYIDDV